MPAPRLEDQIARLYQLPLSEFTGERNLLAKQAGSRAAEVRALQKPPVAAWAVNQLFWQRRETYERLIGAAADLRKAHAAVLGGGRGDVRAAGQSHEEAIDAAIKATLALLREAGQPATDQTRQAVVTTLRALPGDDPPGQLTKTLQPGGFEMLAGLPVKGRAPKAGPAPAAPARAAAKPPTSDRADAEARERARQAAADAERAVRLAEHTWKREEFEAARAARDAEKAAKAVAAAKAAFEEAEAALAGAQRQAGEAEEARAAAEQRAREAEGALEAARAQFQALKRRA
jgi:hypothetical protein